MHTNDRSFANKTFPDHQATAAHDISNLQTVGTVDMAKTQVTSMYQLENILKTSDEPLALTVLPLRICPSQKFR